MKSQVLHTVWCNISGEAAEESWCWSLLGVKGLTLSLPRAINFSWSLTSNVTLRSRENLAFHSFTQMKADYTSWFSVPHLYISLWKFGRMYFLNLGVEGLREYPPGIHTSLVTIVAYKRWYSLGAHPRPPKRKRGLNGSSATVPVN